MTDVNLGCGLPAEQPVDPSCNIQTYEAYTSREVKSTVYGGNVTDDKWELIFFLKGSISECDIRARIEHAEIGLPPDFHGQPLLEYSLRMIGWGIWECRATYAWRGPTKPAFSSLPTQISFSTTGGRVRLTQSLLNRARYPETGDNKAPWFEQAINWDGERINGVEVISSSSRYTETWIFDKSVLFATPAGPNDEYRDLMDIWSAYTGTVHGSKTAGEPDGGTPSDPLPSIGGFRQWKEGEVLFTGAQMRQIGIQHYEVTYEFQIEKNSKFYLPDSIDPPDTPTWAKTEYTKEGWDYLWYYYGNKESEAGEGGASPYQMTAAVPKFAYVEQVYNRENFLYLGVGTNPIDDSLVSLIECPQGYEESYMIGDWETYCWPPPP